MGSRGHTELFYMRSNTGSNSVSENSGNRRNGTGGFNFGSVHEVNEEESPTGIDSGRITTLTDRHSDPP